MQDSRDVEPCSHVPVHHLVHVVNIERVGAGGVGEEPEERVDLWGGEEEGSRTAGEESRVARSRREAALAMHFVPPKHSAAQHAQHSTPAAHQLGAELDGHHVLHRPHKLFPPHAAAGVQEELQGDCGGHWGSS